MAEENGCSQQYGIPTPKSLPAFSADEAEKVAQSFGACWPVFGETGASLLSRADEQTRMAS